MDIPAEIFRYIITIAFGTPNQLASTCTSVYRVIQEIITEQSQTICNDWSKLVGQTSEHCIGPARFTSQVEDYGIHNLNNLMLFGAHFPYGSITWTYNLGGVFSRPQFVKSYNYRTDELAHVFMRKMYRLIWKLIPTVWLLPTSPFRIYCTCKECGIAWFWRVDMAPTPQIISLEFVKENIYKIGYTSMSDIVQTGLVQYDSGKWSCIYDESPKQKIYPRDKLSEDCEIQGNYQWLMCQMSQM